MKYIFFIVLALIVTSCSVNQPAIIPTASATLVPPTATASPTPKPHEWIKKNSGQTLDDQQKAYLASPEYAALKETLYQQFDDWVARTIVFNPALLTTLDITDWTLIGIDGVTLVPAIRAKMSDGQYHIYTVSRGDFGPTASPDIGPMEIIDGKWDPINQQIVKTDDYGDVTERVNKVTGVLEKEYPINTDKLYSYSNNLGEVLNNLDKITETPNALTDPEGFKKWVTEALVELDNHGFNPNIEIYSGGNGEWGAEISNNGPGKPFIDKIPVAQFDGRVILFLRGIIVNGATLTRVVILLKEDMVGANQAETLKDLAAGRHISLVLGPTRFERDDVPDEVGEMYKNNINLEVEMGEYIQGFSVSVGPGLIRFFDP